MGSRRRMQRFQAGPLEASFASGSCRNHRNNATFERAKDVIEPPMDTKSPEFGGGSYRRSSQMSRDLYKQRDWRSLTLLLEKKRQESPQIPFQSPSTLLWIPLRRRLGQSG